MTQTEVLSHRLRKLLEKILGRWSPPSSRNYPPSHCHGEVCLKLEVSRILRQVKVEGNIGFHSRARKEAKGRQLLDVRIVRSPDHGDRAASSQAASKYSGCTVSIGQNIPRLAV